MMLHLFIRLTVFFMILTLLSLMGGLVLMGNGDKCVTRKGEKWMGYFLFLTLSFFVLILGCLIMTSLFSPR